MEKNFKIYCIVIILLTICTICTIFYVGLSFLYSNPNKSHVILPEHLIVPNAKIISDLQVGETGYCAVCFLKVDKKHKLWLNTYVSIFEKPPPYDKYLFIKKDENGDYSVILHIIITDDDFRFRVEESNLNLIPGYVPIISFDIKQQ